MVDKGKGDIAVFVYVAPNYYLQGIKGFYEISIGKKSNPEAYEVLGDIFRTPELKEKIGIELSIV